MKKIKDQINAAHVAFDAWKNKTAFERADLLHAWAALILKNKNKLAKIITSECGKLPAEALTEVELAASYITWSAEGGKRIYGEVMPSPTGSTAMVIKQPVGVVGAITPWNFPAAMITRKAAPALAVGCTVVVKPAEQTPKTAIELAKLAYKAGIAKDVISIVTGVPEQIGQEFCTNKHIAKISFTGSTRVGKLLAAMAGANMKKFTMELGGNAPFIVFADADIKKAVAAAIKSRFRNSGQTCICANRFLVHEKIHAEFTRQLTAEVKKLKIAPLISLDAIKKVSGLVAASGGKILCGGKAKGKYFEPTVICDLPENSPIFAAEIFGPVATIFKFKTTDEVIKIANATPYGLAAYIYSENLKTALHVAKNIDFGMIGINESTVSAAFSPFGGMKDSGQGREGSHYGLSEYLEIKYINF